MFGYQKPNTGDELKKESEKKYGIPGVPGTPKFTIFERVSTVNKGADKDGSELFMYLQNHEKCSGGILGNSIKLSFTKFLVGKDGNPLARFGGKEDPMGKKIISKIEEALNAPDVE